jgi:transcriptional regulator with XRE-family HTH domain
VNSVLCLYRQFRNWQESDVSKELSISVQEYKDLESGFKKIDAETALKLSELYLAPAQFFLFKNSSFELSIIYSKCHFQNSNGYVNNLYNDSEAILKVKDEMLQMLKEEVKLLRELNEKLIEFLKT